jgi:hypothetical protein
MIINLLGYKISLEIIILFVVIYLIIMVHSVYGCCHKNKGALIPAVKKEGFAGANTNYGEFASYKVGDYSQVDTTNWIQPNLLVKPGEPIGEGVNDILNRKSQPLPLPEGEMLMFADTPFRPECCPNTYSNSSGCACMSSEQVNFLKLRGMGNVPYSEY